MLLLGRAVQLSLVETRMKKLVTLIGSVVSGSPNLSAFSIVLAKNRCEHYQKCFHTKNAKRLLVSGMEDLMRFPTRRWLLCSVDLGTKITSVVY